LERRNLIYVRFNVLGPLHIRPRRAASAAAAFDTGGVTRRQSVSAGLARR
jgi:hypothetical protein